MIELPILQAGRGVIYLAWHHICVVRSFGEHHSTVIVTDGIAYQIAKPPLDIVRDIHFAKADDAVLLAAHLTQHTFLTRPA